MSEILHLCPAMPFGSGYEMAVIYTTRMPPTWDHIPKRGGVLVKHCWQVGMLMPGSCRIPKQETVDDNINPALP